MIDVVVQELASRKAVFDSIETGPSGQHFFLPFVCVSLSIKPAMCIDLNYLQIHYMKCEGYRMTPTSKDGCYSVDGERFPFEPCEVRMQGLACHFLSPTGKFVNNFTGAPV